MAPLIATDSEGSNSSNNGEKGEEGAMGEDDVFQDGVRFSKEEDGGRDEGMAEAFRGLGMIDPRRKKIM